MFTAVTLGALTLLVYAPVLVNGFVYDDHHLVERNPVVRTLNPATHLGADFWSRREAEQAHAAQPGFALPASLERSERFREFFDDCKPM